MKRGIFIAQESLDGAGKSTVIQGLAKQLNARLFKTPPEEFREVRHLFDDVDLGHKPFYASTVALTASRIDEALAAGSTVICDRYWLSTKVYGAMRPVDINLDAFEALLLRPDVTIYLEIDEATRRTRLTEREELTSLDHRSLADAERLRLAYNQELTKPFSGKVIRIDTSSKTPEEIVAEILHALKEGGYAD